MDKTHPNYRHGESYSVEYSTWQRMKQRCYDSKTDSYKFYGGKGIKVCKRWIDSFESFLEDMGRRPAKHPEFGKYSIDRINSEADYSPDNCKWSHAVDQIANRSNTVYITLGGVRKTLAQWIRDTGLSREKITYRIKAGWSDHDVLS